MLSLSLSAKVSFVTKTLWVFFLFCLEIEHVPRRWCWLRAKNKQWKRLFKNKEKENKPNGVKIMPSLFISQKWIHTVSRNFLVEIFLHIRMPLTFFVLLNWLKNDNNWVKISATKKVGRTVEQGRMQGRLTCREWAGAKEKVLPTDRRTDRWTDESTEWRPAHVLILLISPSRYWLSGKSSILQFPISVLFYIVQGVS